MQKRFEKLIDTNLRNVCFESLMPPVFSDPRGLGLFPEPEPALDFMISTNNNGRDH